MLLMLCITIFGCGAEQSTEKLGNGEVDVDLTQLSSTIIYSEVYNMMNTPKDYLGKTIKISGQYYAQFYEPTQQYYNYVLIADATACCQQGIEFVLSGEHTYPDDYPDNLSLISVTGVFSTYDELGVTYYYLAADEYTPL